MNAQAKVAHVNVAEIMTKMPAMLDAQKQLEKLSTTYDAEYKKMVTEYQDLLKKYDAEAKAILSKPEMLALKKLEVEMEWAKRGISPYGNNNVFGSETAVVKGLK